MATGYGSNINYADEIAKRKATGDLASAAILEQQRNAKIVGEKLNYGQTNDYTQYLPSAQTTQPSSDPNALIEQQRAALIQAAKNDNQSSVDTLNNEASKLPGYYSDVKNQAAGQSEVNRQAFNELAVARGLNSGAAGQADLANRNVLQGNLSSADSAMAGKLSDIGLQKSQLATSLSSALSNINANMAATQLNQSNADRSRADSLTAASQSRADALAANSKTDFTNTLGAYSGNYDAKIKEVQSDGDTSNDWQIAYLQAARNEQLAAQQAAATKKSSGGSGGSGASSASFSKIDGDMADIYKMNTDMYGNLTETGKKALQNYATNYGGQYASQLLSKYGVTATASTANTPGVQLSGKAQTIATGMASARRYGSSIDQVVKSISGYVDDGTITYEESVAILKQMGIA